MQAGLAALALTVVLSPNHGHAQESAGAGTPNESIGADEPSAARYRAAIEAPEPLKSILERTVGLVRWQDYAGMTEELRDWLMQEAIDEARGAAAAEGHFGASIKVAIDREAVPPVVTLSVELGEPTRIASVRIDVTGPAAADVPLGTDAIAKLKADWSLPVGEVFTQPEWSAAKQNAVATLAASPYAAAKIARSEAAIDPERRSGDLTVEIDSGPPFRFGDLAIAGLVKYPESLVRNFNTIGPGTPYSQDELDRLVRRLIASGYFASVQAIVDRATDRPDDATIDVAVIEGPTRHIEGGFSYSTDVQFGANARYRDVNVNGKGTQMYLDARVESKVQSGSVRFVLPPNDAGWIGVVNGGAERTDIEGLITRTAYAGTRWHTVDERDGRAASATFYVDDQQPSGAESTTSHALYAELERYWRRVDNLVAPKHGSVAGTQLGAGIPGASTRGFGRLIGRYSLWQPLARNVDLQVRAEAGAVLASTRTGIPSTLLFRTGGDTTVRGYAFDSLGVPVGDAIVPGRYYALASVDVTRWFAPWWGLAAFVDAGNAADTVSGLRPVVGYGIGGRVRTPVGPFRLDLAYGQEVQQFRVHFSMGLTF